MVGLPLDAWRDLGRERTLLGRRVFAVDTDASASGATVLCLHGFPSASWDFNEIWAGLAARHRVVALDFLGFGFSEKPRGHRYSIGEQADLVEALVGDLGLEGTHVLAHDYGDTVAQELLARQNERPTPSWRSLCLLNGGLFPETHRARLIQRLMVGPLGPLLARLMSTGGFARSLSAVFGPDTQPTPEQIETLWMLLEREDGVLAIPSLLGYMRERREQRERWVGALQRSCVPLCVINGSADPVSGAHMVARFRELVGEGARVVELAGVGHYPQLEAAADVERAVLSFFDDMDARRPS